MWERIKNILFWAWELLNFNSVQWNNDELNRIYSDRRSWISKHTRWIKRHFDSAYRNLRKK